jgi:RNA polymerase sigma-70 factor (ECF subfamily)
MADPVADAEERRPPSLETTTWLIQRAKAGDEAARNRLFGRYVPVLSRWVHQRLPRSGRDTAETADLVQLTLMRAFVNLEAFESRGEGAFLGYLRQILLNAIRDEARRAVVRRAPQPVDESLPDTGPTPLESALGRDVMSRYEAGLLRLTPAQREAVLLKVEFCYTTAEIATALGRSPDAARMLLARALVDLAEFMRDPG